MLEFNKSFLLSKLSHVGWVALFNPTLFQDHVGLVKRNPTYATLNVLQCLCHHENKKISYQGVSVDKPVFIVEMPELTDEQCVAAQNFIWNVIRAFESQYFHQLQRYYQWPPQDDIEKLS